MTENQGAVGERKQLSLCAGTEANEFTVDKLFNDGLSIVLLTIISICTKRVRKLVIQCKIEVMNLFVYITEKKVFISKLE